jgi:hypothetical protein
MHEHIRSTLELRVQYITRMTISFISGSWNYVGSQIVTIPARTRSPPDGVKALFHIEPACKYRSHLCLRANLVPILGGNIRESVRDTHPQRPTNGVTFCRTL